jgi:hypothetical protein
MPLTIKHFIVPLAFALLLVAITASAMTPTGSPVKKITSASSISGWHAVDPRRVVISFSPTKNYLLTLRRDCHSLNFASSVSVTTSNNTIYAGFDSVTVDGQRCGIQKINKLSKAEKKALIEA